MADFIVENHICALVELRPHRVYEGPLTQWNEEETLLWNIYNREVGAYSLRISRAAMLKTDVSVSTKTWGNIASDYCLWLHFLWMFRAFAAL